MPADAITIIKDAQYDVSGDTSLPLLYDLVNGDKHRMPVLTMAGFSSAQIEVTSYKGRALLIRSDVIKDGVTIHAEPDLINGVRDGSVQVNVQAALDVTFRDISMPREPVDVTLSQIIKAVADIIPRFDVFFP